MYEWAFMVIPLRSMTRYTIGMEAETQSDGVSNMLDQVLCVVSVSFSVANIVDGIHCNFQSTGFF